MEAMLIPPFDNHHHDSSDTRKAAPAYANEKTSHRHGKSFRSLSHTRDHRQPQSVAGRTGRHRDFVGGLTEAGRQPIEFRKRGASDAQSPRHTHRGNLCDGTPTITKANFILVDNEGQARRMDMGDSEGHRRPFVVQTIMEDDGTPWYVEFWHWITG